VGNRHISEIVRQPGGLLAGLGKGKVFVDMSTVSPSVSRSLAEKVHDQGVDIVDSPVLGSVITLQGHVAIVVGSLGGSGAYVFSWSLAMFVTWLSPKNEIAAIRCSKDLDRPIVV
jgi:hypothetical protein